jgi:limonene-1,2-epoxide hydrolase
MSEGAANRATVEAFWRAYNEERIEDCLKVYAPDARLRHLTHGIDVTGREAIRELMLMALGAVPGRRSQIASIYCGPGFVVTENHFEGTIASTNERVTVNMCYIFQFAEGKVVDQREYA